MKKTFLLFGFILASLTTSYGNVSISGSVVDGLISGDIGKSAFVYVDTLGTGFGALTGPQVSIDSFFVSVYAGSVTGGLFGNAFAIDPPADFPLTGGVDANDAFGVLLFDTATTYRVYTNAGWLLPTDGNSLTLTGGTTAAGASPLGSGSIVPEPSTYAALAGLCALGAVTLRRRRA